MTWFLLDLPITLSLFMCGYEPSHAHIRSCTMSSVSVCVSCLLPSPTSLSSMLSLKEIMRVWSALGYSMRSLQTLMSCWLNVVSATLRRSNPQVPPIWLLQVCITHWHMFSSLFGGISEFMAIKILFWLFSILHCERF